MTLKEFIDGCLCDYFPVTITQASEDLRTEHELVKCSHLYNLHKYMNLDLEIEGFTILHTGTGLCWYISLKRN